jgi:uncharacterized protein with FMN-binding domain
MKRALLIAGGTVGSLGAVFAITPPQLSSTESALGTGLDVAPVASATTDTAAPAATQDPTPAATKAASATKTTAATSSKNTITSSATATATPTAAATKAAQTQAPATTTTSGKAQNGTFTGDGYTMRYGTVQVKITISNGKITDAVAVQAPSGRDQRYTDMAVPVMRQKTLAAQSSNITGVSGASYTAYAWYVSLQSALSKAGWM